MSSLVKLSISGVRSYDNRGRETLAFSKPLTLISGPNGVGKTTIIEALKYATTGDMPPNSRGGAFVHDPKMSGERQVLGQVKLGYVNARGQQMVVTRSMQLTVARKTATFKTLDGQLLVVADGRKETLSSRCADLDVQVPLSLGVSTAVLNSVIFCHQEDSMWPLSEPSNVKKRFDDIFEATKYSKALDAIKSLRKDYTADIKLQQQSVDYLGQDNARATRLAAQIDGITGRVQTLEHEASTTKQEMDATISKLDKLFKQNQDFQKVISELVQARHSSQELESHIATVSADLEVLSESTAELEQRLASYDGDESKLQQNAAQLTSQRDSLQRKIEALRTELEAKVRTQSQLEAEKRAHERRVAHLQALAKEITTKYNLAVTPDSAAEFMRQRVAAIENDLREAASESSVALATLQAELDAVRSERAALQQKRASVQDQLAANKRVASNIQRELNSQPETDSGYHEQLLSDLNAKLEDAQKVGSNPYQEQTEAVVQRIALLRSRLETSNQDLVTASSRFNENSRMMVQRENLRKLEANCKHLGEKLQTAKSDLGVSDVAAHMTSLKSRHTELDAAIAGHRDEVQLASANKASLTKELEGLKKKYEGHLGALRAASVDPIQFSSTLRDVEEDLEVATQNLEQSSFTVQYYESARTQAQKTSHCVLCNHEFGPSELSAFLELISAKIASLPLNKEDAAAAFEETKREAQALRELVGDFSALGPLQQRIHAAESELKETVAKLSSAQEALKRSKQELETVVESVARGQSLEQQAAEHARVQREVAQLRQEVDASSSTIQQYETPEQVQERLQSLNSELASAENTLKGLTQKTQKHKDEIAAIEARISRTQLDLKNLELQEHAVRAKQAKLGELEGANRDLDASLAPLRDELEQVEKSLAAKLSELEALKRAHQAKRDGLDKERAAASRYLEQISAIFAEGYDEHALDGVLEEVAGLRAQLQSATETLGETSAALATNERRIIDFRGQKRVLQDNLQVRTYRSQLETLKTRMSELEAHGAEAQKDRYESEASALQQHVSELSSTHALKLGQSKSLQEQKQQLTGELAKDYARIEQRYLEANTKLECTKGATDDLGKYAQALDAAIMKYHSIKMQEINAVLDELWKGTYMGTDIDTIEIKSEIESTAKRSNHNYRVVMFKRGVELDMRGRCSAGQKLLACVLIRLALSECFGLSSNFLVLDEPTTNLDVANIQALGASLCRIIEQRRQRLNFQLIVITHDEHFLQCLGASNFCDTFFRLYRDSHQHSRIDELPITQLEAR